MLFLAHSSFPSQFFCPSKSRYHQTYLYHHFLLYRWFLNFSWMFVAFMAHTFYYLLWWSEDKMKSLSRVRLFATPWTGAYYAPATMGFSRQEYWRGCHFLLQRIFLTQGLNLGLPRCRQMLYRLSHKRSPMFIMIHVSYINLLSLNLQDLR